MPMYGKIFEHTFDGSLYGQPLALQTVWAYVLSKVDYQGFVELNPRKLADALGKNELTVEQVTEVIETLCGPDTESRSQEAGGARLRYDGGFTYYVINSLKYRSIVNEGERREYMRLAKQKERREKRKEAAQAFTPEQDSEVDRIFTEEPPDPFGDTSWLEDKV